MAYITIYTLGVIVSFLIKYPKNPLIVNTIVHIIPNIKNLPLEEGTIIEHIIEIKIRSKYAPFVSLDNIINLLKTILILFSL
jgi:hypothetical protein